MGAELREPGPDSPFSFLETTDGQKDLIHAFRKLYGHLHEHILLGLPPGRYRSLALTSLEESASWLNKAIVRENP